MYVHNLGPRSRNDHDLQYSHTFIQSQGSYRNMKTKFKDFSRIIPGLFFSFQGLNFIDFWSIFYCFCRKMAIRIRVALHFYHRNIFILVLINTGTTGKLNRSNVPPSLYNKSSDFDTVFFRASHKSKRMEKNRCILLFSRTMPHFQGQFYKIPGQFQDKWHYFEIPGVFQDQGQIQGLFQVCANPESFSCLYLPTFRSQASIVSEKLTVFTFSYRKA